MIKTKRFLAMSIFSLLISFVCFCLNFFGDVSIRSSFDFDSTSHFITGYIFKTSCIVCLIFFGVFIFLFLLSGRIKRTKTVFIVSIIAFVMAVSSTLLVSYFRTDYKVIESIDVLTEKKRSIETFDE